MAPGWTSYHHRLQYQTYDITELLEKDNEITAVSYTHLLRFLQIKIYLAFLTAYITKIFLMNKLFFCRFIFYDVGVKSYIFCD